MINVGIIDLETSKKPCLLPWMKNSYLSTVGLKLYLDEFKGDYVYSYWVWHHDDEVITDDDRLKIVFSIQETIDQLGTDGLLVGHNIKFDVNWLKWINVDVSGVRLWDTQVSEYMLSGQSITIGDQDLSSCCERHGIPTKTDKVKAYWDAGRDTHTIPLHKTLLPYMRHDIDITAELFKAHWKQLQGKDALMKLVRVRQDCLHVVTDIECNGMNMDRSLAEKHVEFFKKDLDLSNAELRSYFGRDDINVGSGRELSACLFGGNLQRTKYVPDVYTRNATLKEPYKFTYRSGKKKGLTVTKYKNRTIRELTCKKKKVDYEIPTPGIGFTPNEKTETAVGGVFQTNKDVLKVLPVVGTASDKVVKHRVLELLLHRSKIQQFTQTFVGTKKDTGLFYIQDLNSDGLLHPNYNQTIASTGRFTSSGPNGQNFPRSKEDEDGFSNPLKQCFVPSRTGGLIAALDMAQLEWRAAALLSKDPVAIREIVDGVDIHLDNAITFFGDAKYRQDAKIMTFRLLYGGSAYAFFMDPKMPNFTLKKWNDIERQYKQKYHVLTRWQDMNIIKVGQDDGWLTSPTGRIFRIPTEEHKKYPGTYVFKETCIKNYPVQAFATADCMPLMMVEMWKRMQLKPSVYQLTKMIGQVHDSILFDTVPSEVKQVAHLGITVFEDLPRLLKEIWNIDSPIPFTGDCTWGPNYGDQTTKVEHDKDGKWIMTTT